MSRRRPPFILTLCLWLVRAASGLVPSRDRRAWRQEWEAELLHRRAYLQRQERFGAAQQVDLFRRALGALPDAAWLRRQLTSDAELVHDLRHGCRLLWKSPAFTASAVGILAVGIGSTVAVVTLLDTLMFRPLPYDRADQVMTLWQQRAATPDREDVAPANFLDWRERATSFHAMAAAIPYSYDFTGGGEPQLFFGAQVTEEFWDAIGLPPAVGRGFVAAEHLAGGPRAVVISDRLWRQRFGADPSILGRPISLDGEAYPVVGVLPPQFAPQLLPRAEALDVWTPKIIQDHERRIRASAWWNVVARLKPGVSPEQAQAEMRQISQRLAEEQPRTNGGLQALVIPMREHLIGDVKVPLLVALGAVVLVLGIGCANVASLLLARGMQREREFSIRAAMGASRGRLVRQLVSESLLISGIAAVLGVALANWVVSAIVALAPGRVLRLQDAVVDGRTVAFAVALTALTAVAFGLIPALQFSRPSADAMRDRSGSQPRPGFRRLLVAAEVALALVLLAGAGLLVRSFGRLTSVDPGFSPRGVVALQVFAWDRNQTPDRVRAFFDTTLERLAALPGVESAGAVSAMPFASANIDIKSTLEVVGRAAPREGEQGGVYLTIATPGYFDVMSIRLRAGRLLQPADGANGAPVAVISEALRRREWPDRDPIGARVAFQWQGRRLEADIVGVVGQVRHEGLTSAPRAEVFLPLAQVPFASMTYVLKARTDPAALIDAAKREVWAVDPLQTFYDTAVVERWVGASVVRQRFSMLLMSAFATLALALCALGIYGVISFTTAQRTREIGVRLALGADRMAIQSLVLREGALVVGAGVLAGFAGAFAATRSMRSLLFETDPVDPLTMGGVAIVITAVGLTACLIPARRATRIDPVIALRAD